MGESHRREGEQGKKEAPQCLQLFLPTVSCGKCPMQAIFGAEKRLTVHTVRRFPGKPGRCSDGKDLSLHVLCSAPRSVLSKSAYTKGLCSALQKSSPALKTRSRTTGSKSPDLLTSKLSLPSASLSIISKMSSWIFSPCKRDQTRVCSFPTENGEELLKPGVEAKSERQRAPGPRVP